MKLNDPVDEVPEFSHFLRQSLGALVNPNATTFVQMLADDAVIEFPYTPPGAVSRVEGKNNIAEYVASVGGLLSFSSMTLAALHRADSDNVVVLEFSCTGQGTKTGKPYNQNYISVITLENGLIKHYRDYWNPLIALEAMGGSEAIDAALQGGG